MDNTMLRLTKIFDAIDKGGGRITLTGNGHDPGVAIDLRNLGELAEFCQLMKSVRRVYEEEYRQEEASDGY